MRNVPEEFQEGKFFLIKEKKMTISSIFLSLLRLCQLILFVL